MSEYSYVEQPILTWLCGEAPVAYKAGGLGWKCRDENGKSGTLLGADRVGHPAHAGRPPPAPRGGG